MAWDTDKSAGDLIESDDWDAMVAAVKTAGSNYAAVSLLGSGNTYLKVDATNNKIQVYIAGTKVAEFP